MAWFGLDQLFLGTDLTAEQQRGNQLDAQINAANQKLQDQGYVPADYAQNAAADIAQADVGNGTADVTGSVNGEFVAGIQQGWQNVLTAPGKVVGFAGDSLSSLLGGILKGIPWWLYLGAAAALFVWMGGLELLKGKLAKR